MHYNLEELKVQTITTTECKKLFVFFCLSKLLTESDETSPDNYENKQKLTNFCVKCFL
jgi:hypothetical protein